MSNNIRASVAKSTEKFVKVKGIVTTRLTIVGALSHLGLNRALDDLTDLAKRTFLIELVSSELDPKSGEEKEPLKDFAHWIGQQGDQVSHECEFKVPEDFGEIGAVLVENQHHKEMFLKDTVFNGFPYGPLHINCESWVHSKFNNRDKRIFFSNKSYLPSETPVGLQKLREIELARLRGDGQGERNQYERIYDYDLARTVLGGHDHPYPRRCRTGRHQPKKVRDKFAWLKDEEFSRQTLAGLNPCSIQLVKDWPLKSELDPEIYAPQDSLITTELVERQIRGIMTVQETTKWRQALLDVFTPSRCNATSCWLWKLAKAHVTSHDSGYHQLYSHWLRTHCATEPYIIAANRQLSGMHPIYRLLFPHFRYTMEINALARQKLINAAGIIESAFSPGKYSIEMSSAIYGKEWRFDQEALPADLIRRGLAVEDPTADHGLKLIIEDYPNANDGLVLYDALKEWVSFYVNHYYPKSEDVESDTELQAWWKEVRTKGHEDKKDEPWWPVLKNQDDLIGILTTIIWVTSGQHAAVNFGQYHYAGYVPNRPTIARTNIPVEDPTDEEFKSFLTRPESTLLDCFPTQVQATTVMAVLDVLSNHSPDEEYIGGELEPAWAEDPQIKAAFERFQGDLKKLEGIIDGRNADFNLKNRAGAGVVPYELLKPYSEHGVTGMGVPNSISI
ncbi:hypothetical protein MKW98_027868 [Papaver atlanticum]|uniref:Lipoxygenase n=1 Tax=Papaver atlanticum TaxID=357466 RepID=A0AAD4SLA0_9MAGN|nr:hypothetical protein MKW98_027868 [Papaver atlanticum]